MTQKPKPTKYIPPSDALAAALVADPRYEALAGEVMRAAARWTAMTPEVGYGILQGVLRTFEYLESKGKIATIEILKSPTQMPEGVTGEETDVPYDDADGMLAT